MPIVRRISFVSLGCPKNLVDSQKILSVLKNANFVFVDEYKYADIIVINTCAFIKDAVLESISTIADAVESNVAVIVTGCLGKQKQMLQKKFPTLLSVSKAGDTMSVLSAIKNYFKINLETNKTQDLILTPPHWTYLKISEGCNHKCSFCIIPNLRGKLHSRLIDDVLAEATRHKNNGIKELIIIAQDTVAYGADLSKQYSFYQNKLLKNNIKTLCEELAKLGLWIRLHYLYPYQVVDDLVCMMADNLILPYLDLPLQHSQNSILRKMRRPARSVDMIKKIKQWRDVCPNITIRSSFIVGFPTESETEFKNLLDFLKIVKLDRVGCFEYSAIKGAQANTLKPHITADIQKKRKEKLMQTQAEISTQLLQNKIDTIQDVIVDDVSDKGVIARTKGDAPDIDGLVFLTAKKTIKKGQIGKALITNSNTYDLYGEFIC
jgi:ribosomal protein S12 methylthiotransferase